MEKQSEVYLFGQVLGTHSFYANSEKSDQYQKFAAYTSCEFARLLYERFLPMEDGAAEG